MKTKLVTLLAAAALAWTASSATAADWPNWRGPNRDAKSTETGLLKSWPVGGPKLLWRTRGMGEGYSGPAVVGNTLYIMGDRNGRATVLALELSADGAPKTLWTRPIAPAGFKGYSPGTRATPTVDGDRIYALSAGGVLACLDRKSGTVVWNLDYVKERDGVLPKWAFAESVLIDGDKLICTPGGPKGALLALNKATGKLIWAATDGGSESESQKPLDDKASYSSPVKATIAGVTQYVAFTCDAVLGVDAKTGKLLWRYARPAHQADWGDVNVMTPIVAGDTVFASSNYKTGGGLCKITKTATGLTATEVWFTKDMANHHGGLILHNGALFGCHDKDTLTCLDHKTGKILWKTTEAGKCSILFAEGLLYCRDEQGPITLVKATTKGYQQVGRLDLKQRGKEKTWTHPVIANGKLYLRDQDTLECYDVRNK